MADEYILIACYLHGKLRISSNNQPSYKGGNVFSFPIRKPSSYQELLAEIYTVSGVSEDEFELNIIWNCPVFEKRTTALPISNDKQWSSVFVLGSRVVVVELFVETHRKNLQEEVVPPTTNVTQDDV